MDYRKLTYILASASPRRKELLTQAGFTFKVIPSNVEEQISKTVPEEVVMELALQKATDVYKANRQNDLMVIGSDTIVAYDGEILGKPTDKEDAFNMLSMLSDRTHQVYTGVALIINENGCKNTVLFHECTDVTFSAITSQEIRDYIETSDPMDKAGSYGIQGPFAIHVKSINGDYNNVVGLPIARIYQEIKKL